MATAPNPKKLGRDREAADAARLVWRITVRGETTELYRADLTPADARAVRQATGTTLVNVLSAAGKGESDLDVVAVLWWLARRHSGEPELAFEAAEEQLPSYDDLYTDRASLTVSVDRVPEDEKGDGSPEA